MDKREFMDKVEKYADNDFICRFCDISVDELLRLIDLDDWMMMVSDAYDQMNEQELSTFEQELESLVSN